MPMECHTQHCRLPCFIHHLLLAPLLLALASSLKAHQKGIYKSQNEARQQSVKLQCEGIHKNGDYWMPCANEKELHKALRER